MSQKNLSQITDWKNLPFFQEKQDEQMLSFVDQEITAGKSILPTKDNIFNALNFTAWKNVKVVILGQDPYPNKIHAHGLAFSIPKNCPNIPMSLQNIFKELQFDLNITKSTGNLEGWAKQGVLLLNSRLTVVEGLSNSHKRKGWERLITEILEALNTQKKNLVFILWGKDAQKLGMKITNPNHNKLESVHPSPLSAYNGFFGSKPFSKTNHYLTDHGISEIDWSR